MLEKLDPLLWPLERDRQMTSEGQTAFVERRPVKNIEQAPLGEDRNAIDGLELNISGLSGMVPKADCQIADREAAVDRSVVVNDERPTLRELTQPSAKTGIDAEGDR